MCQLDLADICKHLKASVISHTPMDFTVAEPFKLGLTDEELRTGITAFRYFLYQLYDALAKNKDRFDVKTSKKTGTLRARFPIIEELGAVLFSLGFHGKLETEPRCELTIYGCDLLEVSKMEKYKHLTRMSKARKMELFGFLSELGFYFDDADLSNNVDFSTIGTFYIQYENDDLLLVGLKLLALAQANIKDKYYRYSTVFMRGDFYPLANKEPKPPRINLIDYANTQPPEIKDWVVDLDKLLTQTCNVIGIAQYFLCGGVFNYTSKKTKEHVCKINLFAGSCSIIPNVKHFGKSNTILNELTENMLSIMRGKNRACMTCSKGNSSSFVQCKYGGKPHSFSHKGEDFELCGFSGFEFSFNNADERNILRKWIELETA
jgi:hypothetical protein